MKNLRIYIDKSKHGIYEKLAKKGAENIDHYPFQTMKDVFMLAVCLGIKNKANPPLESRMDIFSSDVFDEKTDIPVLHSIAFRHSQSLQTLLNEKEVLDIVQDYANGGIDYIVEEIINNPGKPLNNLTALIIQ